MGNSRDPVSIPPASPLPAHIISPNPPIQIAPQHIQLPGFRKIPFEQDGGKIKSVVGQPDFAVCKSNGIFPARSGVPVMIGFHKVQKPAGNVEIFILETTVEKIPFARSAPPSPALNTRH